MVIRGLVRRHQQMAHDVCRQGQGLLSFVFTAGVPRLRAEVNAAQTHYVRAKEKLHDRGFHDRDMWALSDVFADMRAGEAALGDALGRVRGLKNRLGELVGELQAELTALRASSEALARSGNVDAAEESAARIRRAWNLAAYGTWGAG